MLAQAILAQGHFARAPHCLRAVSDVLVFSHVLASRVRRTMPPMEVPSGGYQVLGGPRPRSERWSPVPLKSMNGSNVVLQVDGGVLFSRGLRT